MTIEELERQYEAKIRRVKLDADSRRVDWDVYDPWTEEETHYHTNREGEGIWIGYDYTKQTKGTCDFRLHQGTISGMRKALRKYFN